MKAQVNSRGDALVFGARKIIRGCKIKLTVDIAITTSTDTYINWTNSTLIFDSDSCWSSGDPTRLVPPVAGKVVVFGNWLWDDVGTGVVDGLILARGGRIEVTSSGGARFDPCGFYEVGASNGVYPAYPQGFQANSIFDVRTGDKIRMSAIHRRGSNLNLKAGTSFGFTYLP